MLSYMVLRGKILISRNVLDREGSEVSNRTLRSLYSPEHKSCASFRVYSPNTSCLYSSILEELAMKPFTQRLLKFLSIASLSGSDVSRSGVLHTTPNLLYSPLNDCVISGVYLGTPRPPKQSIVRTYYQGHTVQMTSDRIRIARESASIVFLVV